MGTVAVSSGTGQQGSSIVQATRARGIEAGPIARGDAALIANRTADLDQPATLAQALAGVDTLVLIVPSLVTPANAGEARRGIGAIDVALEAGVRHIIYSSALTRQGQGVLGLGSKRAIEERLRECGIDWTIVRPAFFMENFATFFPPKEADGALTIAAPLPLDRPIQMISVGDIGDAIAAILADLDAHRGADLDLVGDQVSLAEVAEKAGSALGREVRPVALLHQP